jgi:thioredoxin 1
LERILAGGDTFMSTEHVREVNDANFNAEVLESVMPCLVDFSATWCGPCHMLSPTISLLAEKYAGKATVCKVDVDENPKVTRQYGIQSVPTLILFKGGRVLETLEGVRSASELQSLIDKNL